MQHPPIPRLPDRGRSRIAARLAAGLALGMLILELQAADPKRVPTAKAPSPPKQATQAGGSNVPPAAAPPPPKPGLAPAANAATAARIAAARVTTLGAPRATASDVPDGIDTGPGSVTTMHSAETSVAPKANAATAARVAALAKTLPSTPTPVAPDVAAKAADAIAVPAAGASSAEVEAAQPRRRKGVAADANTATAARIAAATQPPAVQKQGAELVSPAVPTDEGPAKRPAAPKGGEKSGQEPVVDHTAATGPVTSSTPAQVAEPDPAGHATPAASVGPTGDEGSKPPRRGRGIAPEANAATAARIAAMAQAPALPQEPEPAVVAAPEADAEPKAPRRRKGIGQEANAATAARIAAMAIQPPAAAAAAGQDGDAPADGDVDDARPAGSGPLPGGKPVRNKAGAGPRANAATAARIAALAASQPRPVGQGLDERSDRPGPESPPATPVPPPAAAAPPGRKGATAKGTVTPEAVTVAISGEPTPSSLQGLGGSSASAAADIPSQGPESGDAAQTPSASPSGVQGQKSRIANAARAATAARIAALALPNAVPLDLSRVFADGATGAPGMDGAEPTQPPGPPLVGPARPGKAARGESAQGAQLNPERGAPAAGAVIKSAALPPPAPEILPPAGPVSPAQATPDERGAAAGEPPGNAESGRDALPAPGPLAPDASAPAGEPAAKAARPGRGGKAGKATGKNGKDAGRGDKGTADADKDKTRAAKDAEKAGRDAPRPEAAPVAPGAEVMTGENASPEQKPAIEPAPKAPALPRQGLRIVALPDLVGTPPVVTVESPESLKPFVQPGDEMTLLESMRRALYYSYAVRAAAARVETTKQTERTALSRLLPRVDARMSAGQAKYDATARPTPPEWMLRVDRSVTAAQPLFNWSDYMTWRQQGALVSAEKERRANTDSATALEAASAFLSVYQAQLIIEYGEAYRELLSDLERYVSERASSGATSLADADRVRARVANAQSILAEGRASLITAMGNLRRLVGALPERVTVGPLDTSILPETLEGARTEATAANPDLLASRREVDAATLERRAVFGRFMPNVELEVSQMEFRNTSGQVGTQSDSRVLVVMNIPIYAGGGDLATTRALAAKRQEKEFNLGEKERKLLFDLESAFSVIESINPRLESTQVELESNLKVVAAFREQLFASNRSLLDVLDAYQRLYQSKVDMTTLLVNEARTKLQVAHLSGRLRQILPTVEIAP